MQLKNFVKEKVSELFEQDNSILKADVTLFEGASGNPISQFCEMQLSVSGVNHLVKQNTDSYEKSVLVSVGALQKELCR